MCLIFTEISREEKVRNEIEVAWGRKGRVKREERMVDEAERKKGKKKEMRTNSETSWTMSNTPRFES